MNRRLIKSEPDISSALEPFWERLQEAASWCAERASLDDPRGCLRSEGVRPRVLEPSYFDAVQTVAYGRRPRKIVVADPFVAGQLLVYFPDGELADGAAEQESKGFFDVNNAPPWDTWVGFFRDDVGQDSSVAQYLIAWVPRLLVPLAQAGIDVNPERCIEWLDDAEVSLRGLLSVTRRGA